MPRTVLPPPGGAQAIPDVANFGWFEYGMRVGLWRLKSVLDKHKIKVTWESMAPFAPLILESLKLREKPAGSSLGHGFIQQSLSQAENQRETIRKSVEEIRKFTGKVPSGWECPGLVETPETLDYLAEAGFQYVADWVNDEQPYQIKTAHGPLVSLPYSVELNDIAMMILQHHEPEEFFRRAKDQFETFMPKARRAPA